GVLSLRPLAVRLHLGDPDVRGAPAARAPAHEVERLAVRHDPRLLIDGVTIDGVGQPLRRGPVRARPGPRPGLADPMRDENVGRRPGHALVAIHREAREVDSVTVWRDRRLIAAEFVVRRERQLFRDELLVGRTRAARRHHGRNDRCPEDSARGPEKVPARQCTHDVLLPAGWLRAIDRSTARPRTTPPGWGLSSEPTEVRQLPSAGWRGTRSPCPGLDQ